MSPLCIPLHGPPTSAGAQYFAKHAKATPDSGGFESALLRSIQAALRGTAHSQVAYSYSASPDDPLGEDELAWNSHTVTLSTGGVLHKKWNFEFEEQAVQYACLGLLEQTSTRNATRSPGHYSSSDAREAFERSTDVSARPTFGPFARVQREHAEEPEKRTLEPTVFVFLRNIGKMFLRNGLEYTFSLPFIVRKAWPLYPHGVMIQRVLEPNEIEEAEFTGDVALPTVFTVTSPFSEAGALAVTSGIIGGFDAPSPAVLKDDDENSRKPLISLPASEVLLWTSNRSSGSTDDVLVTVDADKCQLTVWRYAYVKPKDTPVPLGRHRGDKRKRRSMSGFSRRMSVDESSRESSPLRSESPDYPELPPLSALPGMPPSLSTNMTMTPLGGVSTVPVPKGRRNSLTRNELSMTMDRLVLGEDQLIIPIEVGRMKASFWAEKIFVMNISPNDSFANQTISVSLFDQRWDGKSYRSLMAICLPSSQLMSILSLTRDGERLKASPVAQLPSISATSIRATRDCVCDLLYVDPTHQPIILTHGLYQIPVTFTRPPSMDVVISVSDATRSSVTVGLSSGKRHRTSIPLVPSDPLTLQCLQTLSLVLPVPDSLRSIGSFLRMVRPEIRTAPGVEFEALEAAFVLNIWADTGQCTFKLYTGCMDTSRIFYIAQAVSR